MKKILIVEDDPIVAHIYRTRLEKEDYTVETCADGQSGFYRIHEYHPDAVLLDLMLPKMNGIDILKKIRAQTKFGNTPIVVFTNAYVPNMIQEALSAGASQVFNKATLTPRQILDSLHVLLRLGPAEGGTTFLSPTGQPPAPALPGQTTRTPKPPVAPARPGGQFAEPSFHSNPAAEVHPAAYPAGSPPPNSNLVYAQEAQRAAAAARPAPHVNVVPQINADDAAFYAELFQSFLATRSETLNALRKLLQDLNRAPDEKTREPHLQDLYRRVHALTGSAGIAGLNDVAQTAAALEVLLKELTEKPKNVNASTLRTVAQTIDFLGELFKIDQPRASELPPANILVVDDEILSRRAVSYALEKAGLKSVSVEDSAVALRMATEQKFDVIFLDVQMPGMDGFELCTKIRGLPTNKETPIIFVTSLTDFKSRARSSLSGGSDLIAKPFMFIELTVKAITHVLRGQICANRLAA